MKLEQEVEVVVEGARLHGDLDIPEGTTGLVVFAHGSGSSRHSPRNRTVAATLREHGLGTLLFDLMTEEEERGEQAGGMRRFDIPWLANRLLAVIEWTRRSQASNLPVGLFGSSTGGGAALVAAAKQPDMVQAVVSRGGRPDMAGDFLPRVKCPVLLIVGGADTQVLQMNREAKDRMKTDVDLHIVEGATHLFEERGALDEVALTAATWFEQHL